MTDLAFDMYLIGLTIGFLIGVVTGLEWRKL